MDLGTGESVCHPNTALRQVDAQAGLTLTPSLHGQVTQSDGPYRVEAYLLPLVQTPP